MQRHVLGKDLEHLGESKAVKCCWWKHRQGASMVGRVDVDRNGRMRTEATQRAGAEWQRAVQSSNLGVSTQRQLGCPNSSVLY